MPAGSVIDSFEKQIVQEILSPSKVSSSLPAFGRVTCVAVELEQSFNKQLAAATQTAESKAEADARLASAQRSAAPAASDCVKEATCSSCEGGDVFVV